MPYAKTVRSAKKLHGVKPDPGMLFDLLQARTSETFKENEAGISSMFLYHADILIHGKLSLLSVDISFRCQSVFSISIPSYCQETHTLRLLCMHGLLRSDLYCFQ